MNIKNFENKIIQGDCIKVLSEIPENSIDLVITSPPYNCGTGYDAYDDNKVWEEYWKWSEEWIAGIRRVLKEDGRFCLNCLMEIKRKDDKIRLSPFAEFYSILKKLDFKFAGIPLWLERHRVKNSAWGSWLSASAPYIYNPCEVIIIAYKKYWKKRKRGETTIEKEQFIKGVSGIWDLRTATKPITIACFHPDLPEMCIRLLSYRDDIVLDPFAGSGTTCLTAKRLDRKYVGIEVSEEYCGRARRRI